MASLISHYVPRMASLIRYVAAAKWRPVPLFVVGKVLDASDLEPLIALNCTWLLIA